MKKRRDIQRQNLREKEIVIKREDKAGSLTVLECNIDVLYVFGCGIHCMLGVYDLICFLIYIHGFYDLNECDLFSI